MGLQLQLSHSAINIPCRKALRKTVALSALLGHSRTSTPFGRNCLLQELRIDIIRSGLLFQCARQHHRANNRNQQEQTSNLEWQRGVRVKTAADTFCFFREPADASSAQRKALRLRLSRLLCLLSFLFLTRTSETSIYCQKQAQYEQ